MNNELYHHGVKGQRWGVIRSKEQLGYSSRGKSAQSKKTISSNKSNKTTSSKKSASSKKAVSNAINKISAKKIATYTAGAGVKALRLGSKAVTTVAFARLMYDIYKPNQTKIYGTNIRYRHW